MPLMWDNVTKIKCNIFEWVWLLKNFFRMLCFSEYDIQMLLFVFWLRSRPSIKYVGQVDSTEFSELGKSAENNNFLSSLIKQPKNYP